MNDAAYMISGFKMTGTDRGDTFPEHRISDWQAAGLDKPTSVRLDKLLRLDKRTLKKYKGELSLVDRFMIENKLSNH